MKAISSAHSKPLFHNSKNRTPSISSSHVTTRLPPSIWNAIDSNRHFISMLTCIGFWQKLYALLAFCIYIYVCVYFHVLPTQVTVDIPYTNLRPCLLANVSHTACLSCVPYNLLLYMPLLAHFPNGYVMHVIYAYCCELRYTYIHMYECTHI